MAYQIRNWNDHYETSDTRKLVSLNWVKVPNQQDSLAYRLIAGHKKGPEIFAAWMLMVQVASKAKRGQRGNLPFTPEELGIITGFPASIFKLAIDFLKSPQIAWIEQSPGNLPVSPDASGESPDASGFPPGNLPIEGREGKERKKEETHSPLPPNDRVANCIALYPKFRERRGGREALSFTEKDKAELVRILTERPDYPMEFAIKLEAKKPGTVRNPKNFLADLPTPESLVPQVEREVRRAEEAPAEEMTPEQRAVITAEMSEVAARLRRMA